jgi:uncharacterized damage-inducible protein DinB
MESKQYPIGKFSFDKDATTAKRSAWIRDIAEMPGKLRLAVKGLSAAQLDTPYREGGWTVRQVVHHLADSHMNSFVRFKLALSETSPTIKPYSQAAWAETADVSGVDIAHSLALLEGLHARWVILLSSLTPEDYQRTFNHPESGLNTLDRALQAYAWHGRHHVAHITTLRNARGWA